MSRFNYDDEDMKKAIEAVKKGSPIATAAKTFKVPRMPLSDKCKGKTPMQRKMGPPSMLPEIEEQNLVRWICHLGSRGFPVTICHLLDSVQILLKSQKKPNPFANDRPGRHWLEAFQRRHPEVATRVSQNLTKSRASVSETNIRRWFEEITEYFKQNNMLDVCNDPFRVFNCDETAFFLSPGNNRVLVRKGQKLVHRVINSNEKENITILVMGNAEGELAPPMVVVNLKMVPKSLAASMPQSWAIGRSDNGWMTGQTFFEYVTNVFYPWLIEKNIKLPVILYLDGHSSHLTLPLSEFCKDSGIEIVALYPNSTHFLQPMDVAVFHPLKSSWKKEVYKWRIENAGVRLKRDNFSVLLHKVLKNTLKPEMLKNGFSACGLVPLDPDALDYFKIKNKEDNASIPKSSKNVEDIKNHLKYIECLIPQDKLKLFKESGPTWLHEVEFTELFKIWHQINTSISGDGTKTALENQEDLTRSLDSEIFDDILIDLLPENETIDFVVGEEGTLQKVTNIDLSPKLNSSEVNEAESPKKCDLSAPINSKPDELNIFPNTQPILCPVSCEPSSELSVNCITTQQAPSNITLKDNLSDNISITETDEPSLPTTEIEVLDRVIEVDQVSPSAAQTTKMNIPVNLPSTATAQVAEINTEKDILADIPSPFKNNLFWPDRPKVTKKLKEKIPSVATSKDWQEYFKKKEKKKLEKEQEIQERKRKRLEGKENKKIAGEKIVKENKEHKPKSQKPKNGICETERTQKESWFCNICEEDREEDMIKCQKYLQWMHERCASTSKKAKKFICQICLSNL